MGRCQTAIRRERLDRRRLPIHRREGNSEIERVAVLFTFRSSPDDPGQDFDKRFHADPHDANTVLRRGAANLRTGPRVQSPVRSLLGPENRKILGRLFHGTFSAHGRTVTETERQRHHMRADLWKMG
jgi:hypothetical protein